MSQIYTVAYRLYRENGDIYDEASPDDPLQFAVGDEVLIDGFHTTLQGMAVGDSKRITLSPEQAYGPYRKDLLFRVARANLPAKIQVGDKVNGLLDGEEAELEVTELGEHEATLDGNHPLAGETLILELSVLALS